MHAKDSCLKSNKVIAGFALFAVLVISAILFAFGSSDNNDSTSNSEQSGSSQSAPNEVYTLAEVATHNSAEDCWTIINGTVYNMTNYIARHPGGSVIVDACGQDGTLLFTSRIDDSGNKVGSGTPHSSTANRQLEPLNIGQIDD